MKISEETFLELGANMISETRLNYYNTAYKNYPTIWIQLHSYHPSSRQFFDAVIEEERLLKLRVLKETLKALGDDVK